MKLKRFFRVGGVSRCWLVKKRCGLCSMKCAIKYKCANNVGLLCFVACWLQAQGSFLNSTVPADRAEYLREAKDGNTGTSQVLFLTLWGMHRWSAVGYYLNVSSVSFWEKKNERGTCGREKKAGDCVYWGKGKVYIGRMWNETKEGEQRRRMDLVKNKQV